MDDKLQLEQGAEQIAAFIYNSQTDAYKNNRVVTVSYSRTAGNNWCFGALLGTTACDFNQTVTTESDYCAIDGAKRTLSAQSANSLDLLRSIDSGDGAFSYDPVRGMFVDSSDSLELALSSPGDSYRLKLQMNSVGRINLCSDGSDYKIPGYSTCAVQQVDSDPVEGEGEAL